MVAFTISSAGCYGRARAQTRCVSRKSIVRSKREACEPAKSRRCVENDRRPIGCNFVRAYSGYSVSTDDAASDANLHADLSPLFSASNVSAVPMRYLRRAFTTRARKKLTRV